MESVSPPKEIQRFRVDEIRADNAAQVCSLFERIFHKPMPVALWEWKYPASGGRGIGVWEGDTLVAHYGGAGTDAVFEGGVVRNVQICDVMVDPSVRQGVRQQSPFFLAATHFIERFVGSNKVFLMGYGFPSDRSLRLAKHLGIYAEVGSMSELDLSAAQTRILDHAYRLLPVVNEEFGKVASLVDLLWQQQQASQANTVALVKNARRIHYRYVQHPANRYQLVFLQQRIPKRSLALLVLKEESDRLLLMDVIGDQCHLALALRKLAWFCRKFWSKPLVFWYSSVHAERLKLKGVSCKRLPIVTPANIWTDSPHPDRLLNRWCLTAGDTDFL